MEAQDKATASFFFNDRGAELEKSGNGFLRALVAQILRQIPSLFSHILPEYEVRKAESDSPVSWSAQFLTKTLIAMVHALADESLWLVIDAFDECAEESRDSLLDLVENVATAPSVHILITSRMDPIMVHRMSRYPTIHVDDHVHDDIKIYIESEFDNLVDVNEREAQALEGLRRMILHKSQGIFLWVKLVVRELKYGKIKGHTVQEMRDIIDTIPGDLEALFDSVFERLDQSRGNEVRRMLELVLFAKWPLSLPEVYYAIAISSGLEAGLEFTSLEGIEASERVVELSRMEQRLRDLSGGLIEVVKASKSEESEVESSSEGGSAEGGSAEGGSQEWGIEKPVIRDWKRKQGRIEAQAVAPTCCSANPPIG